MTIVFLGFSNSGFKATEFAAILAMIFLLDTLPPLSEEKPNDANAALALDHASAFTISLEIIRFLARKAAGEHDEYAKQVIRALLDSFLGYQMVCRALRWDIVKFQRDRAFDVDNFFGDIDERILETLEENIRAMMKSP